MRGLDSSAVLHARRHGEAEYTSTYQRQESIRVLHYMHVLGVIRKDRGVSNWLLKEQEVFFPQGRTMPYVRVLERFLRIIGDLRGSFYVPYAIRNALLLSPDTPQQELQYF